MTIRKKLIEVSIPLEAINKASKKQKAPKGYPTAIHKYWAQRPIAACRGVLFAQLVDDPSSWPDKFPTEEEQDKERARLHRVIERMVPWEASNNETILNEARWEIARSVAWGLGEEPPQQQDTKAILEYLQAKAPPVYDPFSGGGSIPLEAQRLGLRSYGSDLNPVAVLIGKGLVEIPPMFAGQPPINPTAQSELKRSGGTWVGKGAQGLAADLRYYGDQMISEAEALIGSHFPDAKLPNGSPATVVAWLWSRTVPSPDPAAKGAMVPLVSSFMTSTKAGKKAWVEVVLDASAPDGWRFEVHTGTLSKERETKLKAGTINRTSGAACVLTGASMPFEYLRGQAKAGRMSARLMAVVAKESRGRVHLSPTIEQEIAARQVEPIWEPDTDLPAKALGFRVQEYGMTKWCHLYTKRQLLALTTFSDLVTKIREDVQADALSSGLEEDNVDLSDQGRGAKAYADAIATYLAFCISRCADYGSTISTWLSDDNAIRGTFGRQAIPMTWDFCEGNYFGESSAALCTVLSTVSAVIDHQNSTGFGQINAIDAAKNGRVRQCGVNSVVASGQHFQAAFGVICSG